MVYIKSITVTDRLNPYTFYTIYTKSIKKTYIYTDQNTIHVYTKRLETMDVGPIQQHTIHTIQKQAGKTQESKRIHIATFEIVKV